MADSSYDLLPYEDYCFPATHPEHLHCAARLLGHPAPPFDRCRVLELGCARGGNLVPMALDLPGCEFVGVDLSRRQVDEGNATIARLGLRNVALHAMSILDVGPALGAFDYVLCHGVYTWVPPAVQAGIFDVCRERTTPAGVAYVSYNTLPGWSVARTLRDYLLLDGGGGAPAHDDPARAVARAREALARLAQGLRAQPASSVGECLRAEAEALAHVDDSYLFHEYLEEINAPLYVTDFVRAARARGLDYLCDADPSAVVLDALRDGAADPLAREQDADFARARRFRASLLARPERMTRRAPAPEELRAFHLATRAELAQDTTEAELRTDRPLAFEHDGRRLELRAPLAKCALAALVEAQRRPVAYGALSARVAALVGLKGGAAGGLAGRLAREADLLGMVFSGVVELRGAPARYAQSPGARPLACPLARHQVLHGAPAVTNRRHRQLELAPAALERTLLPLLDGTRDRAALGHALAPLARAGALALAPGATLPDALDEALEWLALNALLLA